MFIDNFNIKGQWLKLSDLLKTVDETAIYFIQNNGGSTIACRDSLDKPDEKSNDGIMLFPKNMAEYKKGEGELYLKAIGYSTADSIISVSNNR